MRLRFLTILVVALCVLCQTAAGQGLEFQDNERLIDERTSYIVFHKSSPEFSGELAIQFKLLITKPSQIGYIFRIKNQQANKTYNMSFNEVEDNVMFKINEEGKSTIIAASISKKSLEQHMWHDISIRFDMSGDSLVLKINGEVFGAGGLDLPQSWSPQIFFGKSEHIIDVPAFAIRDLVIRDNKREYFFPLSENKGNVVHDMRGRAVGYVENPVWLINNSYYWAHHKTISSKKVAGTNFNPGTQDVYFFDSDSIRIYNIRTGAYHTKVYKNPCPVNINLGTNFLDEQNGKLYVYEVYRVDSASYTTIGCLDLNDFSWTGLDIPALERQSHHHGGHFDAETATYTFFGGFGNLKYSNDFFSYKTGDPAWTLETNFTGDRISPRYFLSLGHNEADNSLYVFGGMGNESGDQVVGRRYYYDMYRINPQTKTIRKMWELQWEGENVVPVRNMVIADDSSFYTLCYPEHFSNSTLRLYRFSIKDGHYQILGDSIPIRSEKIKTNANLYFDQHYSQLCAIVQEFDNDDIASSTKIYTISFPPISRESLGFVPHRLVVKKQLWITVLLVVIAGVLIWLIAARYRRGWRKRTIDDQATASKLEVSDKVADYKTDRANAIYLFGEFTVRDRKNIDISHMFSTQLRQVFTLILSSSHENGISSQLLSEIMWPDRPDEKVKNSRGVTINHLRKLLAELDDIQLLHEKGAFKLVLDNQCYCDYLDCMKIVEHKDPAAVKDGLIKIVSRGKFLRSIDLPQLDSFKQFVERTLETALMATIRNCFDEEHYKTTIRLAEAVFDVDPVSEIAIQYIVRSMLRLKMTDEAKKRYYIFAGEYRKSMGEEFPKTFSELAAD